MERELGAGFMGRKRQEARERKARVKTMRSGAATQIEPAPGQVDQRARRDEVIPWLRQWGLRADEAKRGAAHARAIALGAAEQAQSTNEHEMRGADR